MKRLGLFSIFSLSLISICQAQTYLGGYTGYTTKGKAITVQAGASSVRFIFYKPDVLRLDFLPSSMTSLDSSLVVIQDTTESVSVSLNETDSTLQLASSAITILCWKNPFRLSYYSHTGQLVLAEPSSGGLATNQAERWVGVSLSSDEH